MALARPVPRRELDCGVPWKITAWVVLLLPVVSGLHATGFARYTLECRHETAPRVYHIHRFTTAAPGASASERLQLAAFDPEGGLVVRELYPWVRSETHPLETDEQLVYTQVLVDDQGVTAGLIHLFRRDPAPVLLVDLPGDDPLDTGLPLEGYVCSKRSRPPISIEGWPGVWQRGADDSDSASPDRPW